jgi:hypothetical protein
MEFVFTNRDYIRFGIDLLKLRGYKVEVWDLSPLFNPKYSKKYHYSKELYGGLCKRVSKMTEVRYLLSRLCSNDIVISISAVSVQNYFLYKEINKKKIRLGFFQGAYLPQLPQKKSLRNLNKHDISYAFILKIFQKIRQSVNRYLQKKIVAEFVVTLGLKHSKEICNIFGISDDFYLVKSHSLDFDRYIRYACHADKNKTKHAFSDCVVFLDEAVTHHSDYDHSGTKPDCNEYDYYYELNEFFDYLEETTGNEVVIAAHPKSNYKKGKDFFNGRKIVYGKTVELVCNARLVVLHASTSVNFAILYEKPLVYVTSRSYSNVFREKIKLRANILNLDPVSLPINKKIVFNYCVDVEIYKQYSRNYIKYPGSENKLLWNAVCDYIELPVI